MIQIRPGDLIAVRDGSGYVLFAILTRQILFGGHWCYVFRNRVSELPKDTISSERAGFNAIVDFLVAKRENRVERISRGNDFSQLNGPELLHQPPTRGMVNYTIWRWMNNARVDADFVRATDAPTPVELGAPYYGCMQADSVCLMAAGEWQGNYPRQP